MLTLLRSTTEHEKYVFLPIWKYRRFTCNSAVSYNRWVTVKRNGPLHFIFSVMQHFIKIFKQRIVWELNTSAIIAIIKSSMKPRLGSTANAGMENERGEKEGIRKIKVAPWCIWQLLQLVKRHISGRSDIK